MPITRSPMQSLDRIEAWMVRCHPDRLPLFRSGADEATLQRVEARLGTPMPPEIRLLYAAHDGQPEGAPALYLNQRWLPLDLMRVAWEDLCLRYCRVGAAVEAGSAKGRLLADGLWSADWLPVFGSPRGDHYCIDLRPAPATNYGQIVWFLYDHPERAVVAQSLTHMIKRVADGLEAGRWRLDDGYDGLSD